MAKTEQKENSPKGITIENLRAQWAEEERLENEFKEKWGSFMHWTKYKLPWWVRYGLWFKLGEGKRSIIYAYQRVHRGYDDRMVWGFNTYAIEQMLEILKWHRENRMGSPYVTDEANVLKTKEKTTKKDPYDDKNVHKRYDEALDIMIEGFQSLLDIDEVHIEDKTGEYDHKASQKERDRLWAKWQKGAKLFVDNINGIWD
jgi:hypothetical protein